MLEARTTERSPEEIIHDRMQDLSELVNGYDFAQVIAAYWRGQEHSNEELKTDAVRWLRGEFATRTDARHALGVRTIIDDANFYDQLKLLARFVRLAGYRGLLVMLDELVNLYKLASTRARNASYEQILRILNDTLQGAVEGLGFIMAVTPDALMDSRRGLYSYAALHSRLQENTIAAAAGVVDCSGPVIRLANLTPEDFYVLLMKLRHVQAGGDESAYLVPDEALHAFLRYCSERIGDAYFRTPRNTIRAFLDLLAVLEQNPTLQWQSLVGQTELREESNPDLEPLEDEADEAVETGTIRGDELADFRI